MPSSSESCWKLIVLESLVTNREAVSKVSSVLKIKRVTEAQKIVERVNPGYWPTPMAGSRQPDGTLVGEPFVAAEFLRKADWGREHGFLSELVHDMVAVRPSARRGGRGREAAASVRLSPGVRQHLITLATGYRRVPRAARP